MIKTKKRRTTTHSPKLLESWNSVEGSRIDLEKGIVRGVKVLGETSVHGYKYSPAAMKAAVSLYEGVRVNIDHPSKEDRDRQSRSYADRFGRIHNAKFVESKKAIFGDLHYNKKHRLTEQFEYDVQKDPKNLGLSHNAKGDFSRSNRDVVESITSVTSVDLVADPATTAGLFESEDRTKDKKKLRARRQPTWQALMEGLGMDLGETQTPREAIAKLLEAIMLDGSLSAKQRKEKILQCLEMDVDSKNGSATVKESQHMTKKPDKTALRTRRQLKEAADKVAKLEKQLRDKTRESRVRGLCESMNFTPKKFQLKSLIGAGSKREAKQLIESWMGEERRGRKKVTNKPTSRAGGESGGKRMTEAQLDDYIDALME